MKQGQNYSPLRQENVSSKGKLHGRSYTYADVMASSREREQPLKGFEEHFGSLVDYILRITYRIWEDKNVGLIYQYYAQNLELYTPLGFIDSVQAVVEDTTRTLQSFPNRQLYSLNVIGGGDENDGYLSSHLIRSVMLNTGDSTFGKATGKKIDVLTIADCLCKENQVIREWLVRDNGDYIRQLGFDIEDIAEQLAQADLKENRTAWFEKEMQERINQTKFQAKLILQIQGCPSADEDVETIIKSMFHDIWTAQHFGMVDDYYFFNVQVHGLGGRSLCGTPNLQQFLAQFHATLTHADFKIEHIQSIDSDAGDHEKFVHVRWSICGNHASCGLLGRGTGTPLYVMGISHFRLVRGRIAEEWTVFDELALWKQIKLAQVSFQTNHKKSSDE